jgi:ATP-dependent Clp protease ATP-binding subunit ClpC
VFDRFGSEAHAVLASAEDEARRLGHSHMGTEHVLLGLLDARSGVAGQVLRAAGATQDGCRSKVAELVGPPIGSADGTELSFTDRAKRALLRADRLSLRRHDEYVEPDHILLSLLDVEGTAGQVLRGVSVDVAELRVAVSKVLDGAMRPAPPLRSGEHVEPRCNACGSSLGNGPSIRVLRSEDEDARDLRMIVTYCGSCGGIFSVSPG